MIEVHVKICGLTEVANALACAEAGADLIGLNFHPASPRSISIERGAEISRALQGPGGNKALPVGLVVDRPGGELADLATRARVDYIQLHGDESPEYLLDCSRIEPEIVIIRAFRLSDRASVDRMVAYLGRAEALGCPPYAILVDAHVAGHSGGTGRSIPCEVLDHLPAHPRLILAGGLTPENVAERVARVRPWMVDVASGVESSPGVKDLVKVKAFIEAIRRVS